jgi:23S rRNA pseudouridine1911/1915/1917 synthase
LYEDNHCVAVSKPAGEPTTGYQGTIQTLDRRVKAYLKERYAKPGNVFLGIVHRLDRPVSGVVLFARTSKAAARLARQFREGLVEKVYWAVVEGVWEPAAGTLEDWLAKDEARRRVVLRPAHSAGARLAVLHYERRGCQRGLSWLELRPQTGRKHQIRVQLASRGHPIYGDVKYGSIYTFDGQIALHARSLTFLHPVQGKFLTVTADVPESWRRFRKLGLRVPGGKAGP